jgi:L-galactono-1,4-lactone dehydrogenase
LFDCNRPWLLLALFSSSFLLLQQWVWEVCFPTGTQEVNNGNDMRFMLDLLDGIENNPDTLDNIPAHAPIEQRWSSSSSSYMSPASSYVTDDGSRTIHSWVGIINYLPSDETTMDPATLQQQRKDITDLFQGKYCDLLRDIGYRYNATSHWAKIELPKHSIWKVIDQQLFLQQRFPIEKFNNLRLLFDPKNLLSNPLIDQLFGRPK